ncbi:MAG: hypothetical protein B9S34_06265 [Opitutia bacterium Tous-C1TDCM]|nr:MAG: hypothetical protein B9S34_06265 [Opitutae bacterium Tous-C1TDCM]
MNALSMFLRRSALVLTGALLGAGAQAAEADAFPTFDENYIKVSGQVPNFTGSKAAYQTRTRNATTGFGGIEAFNYTKEVSRITTATVDGRVLPGSEDYWLQFKVVKNEVGAIDVGYKRFRTFYDGAGGFFPLNNAWLPIYQRALHVDRGDFYVNATIALPKAPVFTFRYRNQTRTGRKDSTIWGDTDFTGVPISSLGSQNVFSANRKIIPAYLDLGERQEQIEASVRHTVGKTTGSLTLVVDRIDNLNTRSVDRFPGQLRPFPAIPANPPTLVPPALANSENKGFDQQGFEESSYGFIGKVETAFSDRLTGFVQAHLKHAAIDTSASRLITGSFATLAGTVAPVGSFTAGGRPPYSHNSTGDLDLDVLVGTVGLNAKPNKDLRVDVALKLEHLQYDGRNNAVYVNNLVNQTTGSVTQLLVPAPSSSSVDEKPVVPEISLRYTGITKVSLFATWDYRRVPGDEKFAYASISPGGGSIVGTLNLFNNKVKESHTNVRLGGSWTPNAFFNGRAEFFTKNHENRFDAYLTGTEFYFLDYDISGVKLTGTFRPNPQVGFTTRYVQQRGKAAIASTGYAEGDSNNSRRHNIAATLDLNPSKLVYVQANVNVVFDKLSTAYPRAGGSANDVLRNADNNYWNGNVVTGYVLDKNTDALIEATYYKADNYNTAIVASDPYGAGGRDYTVAFGVKHKFTPKLLGSAKVGYIDSRNLTAGGNSDFKGPLFYAALEHAF